MKKLLTFMLCICTASMSYAQLKVHSNGYTAIARTTTAAPTSPLTIGDATNTSSYYNISVASRAVVSGSFNAALEGYGGIGGATSGRSFGARGIAGDATSGWCYGIFGGLNTQKNGAGVFGTIHNTTGVYVDGLYAGYFDGQTKVSGKLTVTGGIDGMLLSAAANESSMQLMSQDETGTWSNNISSTFSGLNAISYYKEQPVMTLSEENDTSSNIATASYDALTVQNLSKKHYALSATQLAEVYPDLVYENEDGSKRINYVEMIPLLVQSINELNAKIAVLEGSNAKARGYNNATGIDGLGAIDAASLSQNNPNPFTTATNIEMQIPSDASTALFCIYDMSGKQIKQNVIHERGKTTLNVASEGLSAGMYLYSLIIDGKVIDTRRMIFNK